MSAKTGDAQKLRDWIRRKGVPVGREQARAELRWHEQRVKIAFDYLQKTDCLIRHPGRNGRTFLYTVAPHKRVAKQPDNSNKPANMYLHFDPESKRKWKVPAPNRSRWALEEAIGWIGRKPVDEQQESSNSADAGGKVAPCDLEAAD